MLWPPDAKSWLFGKNPDAVKDGRQKEEGEERWQRMRWLDGITETMGMSFSKLHKTVKDMEVWCVAFRGVAKIWTWLHFLAFWLRSSGGSDGKGLSTMWETWVRSLGREVPWRRKRQPTPVRLPRKSHGWRSLVSMGLQRVGHDWATSLSLRQRRMKVNMGRKGSL